MHSILVTTFWGALGCLLYSYIGYPCLVSCAARWWKKGGRSRRHEWPLADCQDDVVHKDGADSATQISDSWPNLTVLIAAYNAEAHIAARITNLLACDYPSDKLQIVVASDGSRDATVAQVTAFQDSKIWALDFAERRGKAATLIDAVTRLSTEIVVFTDATTRFDPAALRKLARHFVDPKVGLVTGHVEIVDQHGRRTESLYWHSEMMVRRCEAQLGIMLGASGAIYALRRHLFVAPRRPVINDDLVFPTLTQLRHNCNFVLDDSAIAYATVGGGLRAEFLRRSRIGAGALQCIPALREIFQWRHATKLLAFASHKLLRWTCPVWLVLLLVVNVVLVTEPLYQFLLGFHLAVYLLALSGVFMQGPGLAARLARTATTFVVMNLALLTGLAQWVVTPQNVLWTPTQRPQSSS